MDICYIILIRKLSYYPRENHQLTISNYLECSKFLVQIDILKKKMKYEYHRSTFGILFTSR